VGGGHLGVGLLDDLGDPGQPVLDELRPDGTVQVDVGPGHLLDGDHASAVAPVDVDHVGQQIALGDDVVAQEDGERLAAHMGLGHGDGRPEPERILLSDVVHGGHVADLADLLELVALARGLEPLLELVGPVEVVLDGPLPAPGDDQDVGDPGLDGVFHHVLDGGLVDEREHLLRLCLRRRKEPGSQAGRRDDRLLDSHRTASPGGQQCTERGRSGVFRTSGRVDAFPASPSPRVGTKPRGLR
jgi:hypothetical protein